MHEYKYDKEVSLQYFLTVRLQFKALFDTVTIQGWLDFR